MSTYRTKQHVLYDGEVCRIKAVGLAPGGPLLTLSTKSGDVTVGAGEVTKADASTQLLQMRRYILEAIERTDEVPARHMSVWSKIRDAYLIAVELQRQYNFGSSNPAFYLDMALDDAKGKDNANVRRRLNGVLREIPNWATHIINRKRSGKSTKADALSLLNAVRRSVHTAGSVGLHISKASAAIRRWRVMLAMAGQADPEVTRNNEYHSAQRLMSNIPDFKRGQQLGQYMEELLDILDDLAGKMGGGRRSAKVNRANAPIEWANRVLVPKLEASGLQVQYVTEYGPTRDFARLGFSLKRPDTLDAIDGRAVDAFMNQFLAKVRRAAAPYRVRGIADVIYTRPVNRNPDFRVEIDVEFPDFGKSAKAVRFPSTAPEILNFINAHTPHGVGIVASQLRGGGPRFEIRKRAGTDEGKARWVLYQLRSAVSQLPSFSRLSTDLQYHAPDWYAIVTFEAPHDDDRGKSAKAGDPTGPELLADVKKLVLQAQSMLAKAERGVSPVQEFQQLNWTYKNLVISPQFLREGGKAYMDALDTAWDRRDHTSHAQWARGVRAAAYRLLNFVRGYTGQKSAKEFSALDYGQGLRRFSGDDIPTLIGFNQSLINYVSGVRALAQTTDNEKAKSAFRGAATIIAQIIKMLHTENPDRADIKGAFLRAATLVERGARLSS